MYTLYKTVKCSLVNFCAGARAYHFLGVDKAAGL